ncbi:MAG: hypothetical protein CL583_02435 [Alteromonadaceae bacterium]|nr:hypothetical protein [Alteromonadaceae bacterium]
MHARIIKTGFVLLALLAIVVGVQLYLTEPTPPGETISTTSALSTPPSASPVNAPAPVAPKHEENPLAYYAAMGSGLGERPESLDGTAVDGELKADANGQLIISPGVRQVFDYFLTTIGEEDFETVKARLAHHINHHLPPEAAQQAWRLFGQYMGTKEAISNLPSHDGTSASMRNVVAQRRALRQSWFDAEANDAFFGLENAYDEFQLSRREIMESTNLPEAEQQARLTSLTNALPHTLQKMVTATQAPVAVQHKVEQLREQGTSESEIRALREQQFGPEAADRLAQLDQRQAQWEQQYTAYQQQRQTIIDSGMATQDREAEIQRLRERLFDDSEIRRVEALDRIGQN